MKINTLQRKRIADLLCDALKEYCHADCAFINEGLILDKLPKGNVTKYELLKICPHPINPCVVELSGAELKEVLAQTMDEKWRNIRKCLD